MQALCDYLLHWRISVKMPLCCFLSMHRLLLIPLLLKHIPLTSKSIFELVLTTSHP